MIHAQSQWIEAYDRNLFDQIVEVEKLKDSVLWRVEDLRLLSLFLFWKTLQKILNPQQPKVSTLND